MDRKKMALLFVAYAVICGVSFFVVSRGHELLSILWICALVLGGVFFLTERRTGISMREK